MPKEVLCVQGIRQREERLFCVQMLPSLILMENAAHAVTEQICADFPQGGRCLILCGGGNNGGDGFAVARQLAVKGWKLRVLALGDGLHRSQDAATMLAALRGCGVDVEEIQDVESWTTCLASLSSEEVVVDGMFGIGLNRALSSFYQRVFRDANLLPGRKYAIDIPSGVDADTGQLWGEAIRADCTVTFLAAKPGLLLYPGHACVGKLRVAKLDVRDTLSIAGERTWMQPEDLRAYLPPRDENAHKGNFGHGLLIGGNVGMVGAVQHAAKAALRSGIGRLSLAAFEEVAPAIWASLPDAMAYPLAQMDVRSVEPLLKGKTCLALGPGLGRVPAFGEILALLLSSALPLVLDADGLTGLSENLGLLAQRKGELLLTPHPGEMARLCGLELADVLRNPDKVAVDFASKTGAVVLLKGGSSVIAAPDGRLAYSTSGGPALAKGGSGDVLCGIALAFLGQGLSAFDAACCAALTLGMAAESVEMDEKTVLAQDVIEAIPLAFRRSEREYAKSQTDGKSN